MSEFGDGDGADLPPVWNAPHDDAPCEKCPADADVTIYRGGQEYHLCMDCRDRLVLGR